MSIPLNLNGISFIPEKRTRISNDSIDSWKYRIFQKDVELRVCVFADETLDIAVCIDVECEFDKGIVKLKIDPETGRFVTTVYRGNIEIKEVMR